MGRKNIKNFDKLSDVKIREKITKYLRDFYGCYGVTPTLDIFLVDNNLGDNDRNESSKILNLFEKLNSRKVFPLCGCESILKSTDWTSEKLFSISCTRCKRSKQNEPIPRGNQGSKIICWLCSNSSCLMKWTLCNECAVTRVIQQIFIGSELKKRNLSIPNHLFVPNPQQPVHDVPLKLVEVKFPPRLEFDP